MRLVVIALVAFGLLSVWGSPSAAAPKRTTRAHATRDPVADAAAAIALNTADAKSNLYQACRRADFKLLALGLEGIRSRINRPKGEFETNAEYRERASKLEDALNPDEPIIVCQPLDDNEDAPFDYDAEHQVFHGTIATHENVWRDVKSLGSYTGRTAMNVRFRVTASAEFEYNVTFGDNLRLMRDRCRAGGFSSYSYSYEVPAPRESAPRLKAGGYLVFIGRLRSPFINANESHSAASLDDPTETYERDLVVFFDPTEITVVGPAGDRPWTCTLTAPPTSDQAATPSDGSARPVPVGTGPRMWLQLASGTDRATLVNEFHRLSTANGDLLRDIRGYLVESPDRMRLVVGPFRTQSDARIFADDLRSLGIDAFSWTSSGTEKFTAVQD